MQVRALILLQPTCVAHVWLATVLMVPCGAQKHGRLCVRVCIGPAAGSPSAAALQQAPAVCIGLAVRVCIGLAAGSPAAAALQQAPAGRGSATFLSLVLVCMPKRGEGACYIVCVSTFVPCPTDAVCRAACVLHLVLLCLQLAAAADDHGQQLHCARLQFHLLVELKCRSDTNSSRHCI